MAKDEIEQSGLRERVAIPVSLNAYAIESAGIKERVKQEENERSSGQPLLIHTPWRKERYQMGQHTRKHECSVHLYGTTTYVH